MEKAVVIQYILAAALVVVIIGVVLQVLYIRTAINKYEGEKYFKQTSDAGADAAATSHLSVYSWQINKEAMLKINSGSFYNFFQNKYSPQKQYYTVNLDGKQITVEYYDQVPIFIPLVKSKASSRFQDDLLNNIVQYVTWDKYVYKVSGTQDYQQIFSLFFTQYPENVSLQKFFQQIDIVALFPIPSYNDLAMNDLELQENPNRSFVIYSMLGSSDNIIESVSSIDAFAGVMHVIGYSVR